MQLYKKRDFSSFFSDTFQFLKEHGKHFFRQFIVINGFLILILAAITYAFSSIFLNDFFTSFSTGGSYGKLDELMNQNFVLFISLLVALFIFWIIFGIISYAYTPIYFRLFEKTGDTKFTTKDLIDSYKENSGKLIKYLLLAILITIPVMMAFMITGLILAVTIVGLLLLPLLVALFASLYNMTLLELLDNKRNFFDSFGYSWSLILSNFWPAVGCMGIFYFMSYVVQMSLSIFQSGINLTSQLTVPNADGIDADTSLMFIVLSLVVFVLSFAVSILLNTILQINQSIVYYGLKEQNENTNTKSAIDLIGTDEA